MNHLKTINNDAIASSSKSSGKSSSEKSSSKLELKTIELRKMNLQQLKSHLVYCIVTHFKIPSIVHGFFDDNRKPDWYKYLEWVPTKQISKAKVLNQNSTINAALINTITEFYKLHKQELKLESSMSVVLDSPAIVFQRQTSKKYMFRLIGYLKEKTTIKLNLKTNIEYQPPWTKISISNKVLINNLNRTQLKQVIIDGYNYFGYNLPKEYFDTRKTNVILKEYDVFGLSERDLRSLLVECVEIHFGKKITKNFYADNERPDWYKYLDWSRIHYQLKEKVIFEDETINDSIIATILEFYTYHNQEQKLGNRVVNLPEPETLIICKDKKAKLKTTISLLKRKTQFDNYQRSVIKLKHPWTQHDLKSVKQNEYSLKKLYEIILDGYNYFDYNLSDDFFKDGIQPDSLLSVINSTNQFDLICDYCKERKNDVLYLYSFEKESFLKTKMCDKCRSEYGEEDNDENENEEELESNIKKAFEQLQINCKNYLNNIGFDYPLRSKMYVITVKKLLSAFEYSGFTTSKNRPFLHPILAEIFKRFNLPSTKINHWHKYRELADALNRGQSIFVTILNEKEIFPLNLYCETLSFRTNLRKKLMNIKINSNTLDEEHQLKGDDNYYILKKIELEFKKNSSIEFTKEKLSKIDLSWVNDDLLNDMESLAAAASDRIQCFLETMNQ